MEIRPLSPVIRGVRILVKPAVNSLNRDFNMETEKGDLEQAIDFLYANTLSLIWEL